MRIVSILTVALAFGACDNSGLDRLPVDFDTEGDTGDIDGTDVDTDTEDADTDPDTDPGTTGVASACHAADPIDKTGWSRTYSTNYEGTVGTEVQTPGGLGTAPNGEAAYIVNSTITPTSGVNPISLTSYRNCDNGEALWFGEDVTGTADLELFPGVVLPSSINATRSLEDGAIYLPTVAQLESGALIDYEYEIMITKEGDELSAIFEMFGGGGGGLPNCMSEPGLTENDAQCITVQGELTVIGAGNREVNGTTWYAYQIIDIRTELWSEAGGGLGGTGGAGGIPGIGDIFGDLFGFGGSSDTTTTRQIWYVDGIGIVEEKAYDTTAQQGGGGGAPSESDLIVTRQLTSFTGL